MPFLVGAAELCCAFWLEGDGTAHIGESHILVLLSKIRRHLDSQNHGRVLPCLNKTVKEKQNFFNPSNHEATFVQRTRYLEFPFSSHLCQL